MHSRTSIFNKFLKNDPNYVNVRDQNNIMKTVILLRPLNHEIKMKFRKFLIMEDKSYFYRAQRHYHILLRFVQRCKVRKAKTFDIDCDLRMTPFHPTTKIELIENWQIYPFNIHDLINVIKTTLLHQNYLFVKPQYPKNPYTNLNFGVNNLYNIYIKCLELKLRVPLVITYFAESEFNMDTFLEKHKHVLSEWAIESYLCKDATITETLVEDIYDMCYTNNIKIHSEFPKDEAYSIFRPYLKYHYNKKNVSPLLDCFKLYNPFFGRKCQLSNGEIWFDNRHLPFQEIKDGIFKTVYNTKMFNKLNASKYKYKDIYCISLQAVAHSIYYADEEEETIVDEEDDDEYDP